MKRVGKLFETAFTKEAIYQAWVDASKGKMRRHATHEFSKRLASNLDRLHHEIHGGTYRPKPYVAFQVMEPKPRTIYAPSFCDLVVQHAIYRVIYPIYNAGMIDQSFACRNGKGTHRAADYAQQALRRCAPDEFTLKLDIRRFFYRIDRAILRALLERKIKDQRFVDLMMSFAQYGQPVEPLGIPIGNLLSQLFALVYLTPLDHFIKRDLKCAKYCRYVDDFIVFGVSKARGVELLAEIKKFLREKLHLELSKHTLQSVKRGVNFVGYRTWRSRRFIRKHSMFKLSRSAKKDQLECVISILGHAVNTSSHTHLINSIKEKHHALYRRLPKTHHARNHG